ncbi:hypothetical protein LY12_000020 [Prauserella alba]|nr:hypothetical protein [Prauserella alba]
MTNRLHREPGETHSLTVTSRHHTSTESNTETPHMLLHEELTRDRIRELRKQAEGGRAERRHRAARRWQRIARWASRRAEHFDR